MVNNLNGKTILDQTIKMFALVDETPEKADRSVTIDKALNSTQGQDQLGTLVSDLSLKPPAPVTPISSSSPKTSTNNRSSDTPAKTSASKFWNVDETSTSNEEESSDDDIQQIRDNLKRKAVDSPDNTMLAAFERVLSKKQKKKLRKSLLQQQKS